MKLTHDERQTLADSGTDLEPFFEDKKPIIRSIINKLSRTATQNYILNSDCGYLDFNNETGATDCSIYENESRPMVCREFVVGQYSCMTIRHKKGVDPEEVFVEWVNKSKEYS